MLRLRLSGLILKLVDSIMLVRMSLRTFNYTLCDQSQQPKQPAKRQGQARESESLCK